MDLNKQIEYWSNSAYSDFETAELLIRKGKILHDLFFCHLSIKKILKAHYVNSQKSFAPKTHDLVYLLTTDSYVAAPDLKKAEEYLTRTEELLEWLKKEL